MTRRPDSLEASLSEATEMLGDRARHNEPLGILTTYRVGGAASLFMMIEDAQDVALVVQAVQTCGIPVLVLGRGSNVLVADAGFAGLAIMLGEAYSALEIGPIKSESEVEVQAGAAVPLPVLARRSASEGLRGLEWAVGVPGSVGGAVRMNAGGHGSEMASVLRRVHLVDLASGDDVNVRVEDLQLGYRHSNLTDTQVVLGATFGLFPGNAEAAGEEVSEIVRWRREHQPGGQNAGSVFTNPPNDSAGRLIDTAGCKGMRIGSAEVSRKHANFIQADADGSADDVACLITEVRKLVEHSTGVRLKPELHPVGFDSDVMQKMMGH